MKKKTFTFFWQAESWSKYDIGTYQILFIYISDLGFMKYKDQNEEKKQESYYPHQPDEWRKYSWSQTLSYLTDTDFGPKK